MTDTSLVAIAAILAGCAVTPALAQQVSEPDTIPNIARQVSRTDIVVTASSRDALRNTLSPGAVSVIYPDDTKGEHKSMPDLLDQVPGVFVRRVNGTGQYTTASIRGSAPSQVNIYVDGVPYNISGESAADISTIPVSNIERIEVYRGTVPARFSGSPLGGAINIVTKRAKSLSGTISGGIRSFGGWQTSGNLNLPLLGGSLLLGADAEGSKGDFDYIYYAFDQVRNTRFGTGADGLPNTPFSIYDAIAGKRVSSGAYDYPTRRTRQNNGFERYNGLARWTDDHFSIKYSFTSLRRFMPQGAGYANDYTSDLPAWSYPNVPADVLAPTTTDIIKTTITNPRRRQVQQQHDVALGWQDRFGALELSAALNFSDRTQNYDNLDLTGLATLGAYWTRFHTQRYGGQVDLAYTLGSSPVTQRLELHAQASQETMWADASAAKCDAPVPPSEFYCRFRRQLVSFQAQDSIIVHPLGDLQITPVVRVDRLFGPVLGRYRNPVVSGSGDFDWQPTFGVSVKKEFGGWLFFADTGTYNRYPNFYEIYGDGAYVTPGSGDVADQIQLSREHGRNTDIGIGWNGAIASDLRASLRTALFVREAQDEITLLAQSAGARYVNSGTTVTRGAEFEGNLILGQRADVQAALSYQKGRYTRGTYYWFGGASARQLAGDRPVYKLGLPNFAANARLNLHFLDGALTTFGEVRHVGRRYTSQLQKPVSGVTPYIYEKPLTTFDLGAHYKFDSGIALSLGVNDIFNAGPKQRQYNEGAVPTTAPGLCNGSSGCTPSPLTLSEMNVAYPQQGRTVFLTIARSFGAEYAAGRSGGSGRDGHTLSWSGFYVGGSVGRGWAPVNADERLVFDTARGLNNGGDGVFNDYVSNGGFLIDPVTDEITSTTNNAFTQFDGNGVALGATRTGGIRQDRNSHASYGFRAGYDRQIGNWVIGAVAEWAHYGVSDSVTGYGITNFINPDGATLYEYYGVYYGSYAFTRTLNSMASLRLRGGFALGSVLAYGTAGAARADLDETFSTTDTRHAFAMRETKRNPVGLQWGGGIETRIAGPFTLGIEYLQTRLKSSPTVYATGYDDTALELQGVGFQTLPGGFGTDIKRGSDSLFVRALRVTAGYRF